MNEREERIELAGKIGAFVGVWSVRCVFALMLCLVAGLHFDLRGISVFAMALWLQIDWKRP